MFTASIEQKIKEFDKHLVSWSVEELTFEEKQKDGQMSVTLKLEHPSIMFRDVDENCLNYFECKKAADCIVFEQKDENDWAVHIFEMKRTVKVKEWIKIREQFKGAYYNALSLAGFLGLENNINGIKFYTCFLKDKILDSTVGMRASLAKADEDIESWRTGRSILNTFDSLSCKMQKIQINDNCEKEYYLCGKEITG